MASKFKDGEVVASVRADSMKPDNRQSNSAAVVQCEMGRIPAHSPSLLRIYWRSPRRLLASLSQNRPE